MVVLSQPKRQMLGAVIRRLIAVCIRPFPLRGLDEALRLAVGARRIGLGAHMAQTQASAQPSKAARRVASTAAVRLGTTPDHSESGDKFDSSDSIHAVMNGAFR